MTMIAAETAARRGASRDKLLNSPRSGARPLGNSPGASTRPQPAARRETLPAPRPAARPATNGTPRKAEGRPARSGGSQSRTAPRRSQGSGLRTARQVQRAVTPSPEFRNYQGIILAEFVLAELLVAGTPIAARGNQQGLSPYVPRDMTKLLSIGLVYFLLELLAVGGAKTGRFGAWFGGLILLAVGLNEGANVAKDLNLFGQQNPPAGQAGAGEGSAGPVNSTTGG